MNVTYNNYNYVNLCISVSTMMYLVVIFELKLATIDSILLKKFQKTWVKKYPCDVIINFTVHYIAIERCDINFFTITVAYTYM